MQHNLTKNVQVIRLKPDGTNWQIAAGTSDTLTSNSFDTLGYYGYEVEVAVGAISAGGTVGFKAQTSFDDAVTDAYTDLAGSNQSFVAADAQKIRILDVFKSDERYVKIILTRATANASIDSVTVRLFAAGDAAVVQGATVAGTPKYLNHPVSGTA